MQTKRAEQRMPVVPTTIRSTGPGILYGCHVPSFQKLAKLSITDFNASGFKIANSPNAKKTAAMKNSAGASERVGKLLDIYTQEAITGQSTIDNSRYHNFAPFICS